MLDPLHRILVLPAEVESMNQEMDVVAVVPVGIERIGLQPREFVCGRGAEGADRFLNLVALRVDVPGHVQRVRNVRHELGVALA